jgi:hypothetical protein
MGVSKFKGHDRFTIAKTKTDSVGFYSKIGFIPTKGQEDIDKADGQIEMVYDLNKKDLPEIGIKDISSPDILICIPSNATEGEIFGEIDEAKIIREIDKAKRELSEKIEVVIFKDKGDELANMRRAEEMAKGLGAKMAVPVRRDAKAKDIIDEIRAGFLEDLTKDLFGLLNPDLKKLDSISAKLKNAEELRGILSKVSGVLSNTVSKELLTSSIYTMNIRMKNIAGRIVALHEPTDAIESRFRTHKGKTVISITADSLGEVKMLAEAHRERIRFAIKLNPNCATIRLQIRLTVSEKDKKEINEKTKEHLLEKMGINDVLIADDLILADEDTITSPNEIYAEFKADEFEDRNIAIVEKFRNDRDKDEVPDEAVFVEYKGLATPRVYDAALELLASKYENRAFGLKKLDENKNWYLLPEAEEIETEELRNELMRYREALIRA